MSQNNEHVNCTSQASDNGCQKFVIQGYQRLKIRALV